MNQHSHNLPSGKRIFIVGFMGTGKSHWGKLWALRHQLTFIDLDVLIENAEPQSVVDIFENAGEEYFRVKEASILRDQLMHENCIISCGGGTPCFYDNMEWMNENGYTVYLSATAPYMLKNIMDEKEKRPLIKNVNEAELLFFVEQKLKERLPFYSKASLTLDAATLDENSLSQLLLP